MSRTWLTKSHQFRCSTLASFGFAGAPLLVGGRSARWFLATPPPAYVKAVVVKAFCDYCLFSGALVFLLAGLLIASPLKREV